MKRSECSLTTNTGFHLCLKAILFLSLLLNYSIVEYCLYWTLKLVFRIISVFLQIDRIHRKDIMIGNSSPKSVAKIILVD